jgi:hypothetical protein
MGIHAQIETERGERLNGLIDPRGLVNWLLSLANVEGTACLRFIDPYGDTLFNGLQLPLLRQELESIAAELTETKLIAGKKDYLERACGWPARAVEEAQGKMAALSVNDLLQHLDRLVTLVRSAVERGPHIYIRFLGD